MNKVMKSMKWRTIIQVIFFTLVGLIAVNHTLAEAGGGIPLLSQASVHAICPFGGVVTLYQLATLGTFVQKIHSSAVVLMVLAFGLAILFGPVICGWLCPMGSIQEWIGKLGKRIFGLKYNHFIPQSIDKVLRYIRYIILVLVIYKIAVSGLLLFANVDPYFALFHFWTGDTEIAALVILGITLVASLFIERPWCKYACPYGALLGIFNLFRIFKIRRNPDTCISCNQCDTACPMNIEVSHSGVVKNHQCISCLECTSEKNCPVPLTVELRTNPFESDKEAK